MTQCTFEQLSTADVGSPEIQRCARWVLVMAVALLTMPFVWECSSAQSSMPTACGGLIAGVNEDSIPKADSAVRSGCPVNSRLDGGGATALMWSKSAAMTQWLLSVGANADQRSDGGENALGPAAWRGDLASIRLLIAAGARADATSTWVCGALCEAVSSSNTNNLDIVKALLAAGAPPNAANCFNATALFTAAGTKKREMLAVLLDGGGAANRYDTTHGDTLLIVAAGSGDPQIIEMLVRAGGDPNWPNPQSCRTPLHAAAARGKISAVQTLAALGADLRATDSGGLTARGVAQHEGQTEVAAFLSSRGIPPEGVPRTDCVNLADLPAAAKAWAQARAWTRAPRCAEVASRTTGGPVGISR
jgi:ankyrin repeat protein